MSWQPIETAPLGEDGRDGPDILIWTGHSMRVAYHFWDDADGTPAFFDGDVAWRDATHWMPLPNGPEPSA